MSGFSTGTRRDEISFALIGVAVVAFVAGSAVRIAPAWGDFWLDEIWTYFSVRNLDSAVEIFTRIHHSNNNHLNSLAVYFLGDRADWFVYRIPALVAGIGTVLLAPAIAWRWGRLDAAFAAILTGGCFALIHYSSEARGYSLAVFFAFAATWFLQRDLQRGGGLGGWLFGASVILGFLSHLIYLFFYAGAAAQSGWRLLGASQRRRAGLIHLVRLHALPIAAFLWLYAVDLRILQIGAGNPTDFSVLFASTVGYTLGLPVIPELFLPYLLAAGAIFLLGLRLLWREGDDAWILMAITIFVAPLVTLAFLRPQVIAVRYFLIGSAFLLLVASHLLAEWYRSGAPGRALCLLLLALFVIGNAAHTLPFLEHGRGGYLDALLFMARRTAGPRIVVGSDHDFRNHVVLRFYKRYLPPGKLLVYYAREAWPRGGPEWMITHREQRPEDPPRRVWDRAGNRYDLAAEFDSAGISGFYWALYRNAGAAEPAPPP